MSEEEKSDVEILMEELEFKGMADPVRPMDIREAVYRTRARIKERSELEDQVHIDGLSSIYDG